MLAANRNLIKRLQARNTDRERATNCGIHPRKPVAPINTREMMVAERAIGFVLPELIRACYIEVGNGGFGPGYGLVGTKGGARLEGCTLETCYRDMVKLERENSVWRWPKHLLPLANYGCGMWSCVDCDYRKLLMVLWDPNNLNPELNGADAQLNWANSFWDQGLSLRAWLEGWLSGEQEPEPKWPSTPWIRKRLGFSLTK